MTVLDDEPMRLPREQRQEIVGYLTGEGMSTRAIAPIVGVSQSSVRDDMQVSSSYSPDPEPAAEPTEKTVSRDPGEEISSPGPEQQQGHRGAQVTPNVSPEPVWQVEMEAWRTLGYSSWAAMREAEYGGAAFMVPSKNRPELLSRMRAAGLTQQEIADTAGVGVGTVNRDLDASDFPDGKSDAPVTNSRGQQRPATYTRTEPDPRPEAGCWSWRPRKPKNGSEITAVLPPAYTPGNFPQVIPGGHRRRRRPRQRSMTRRAGWRADAASETLTVPAERWVPCRRGRHRRRHH